MRLGEEFVEARVTVGLLLVLLEGALVQLLQTERTGKVFRMVLLEHRRDAATGDRRAATGAQCAPLVVVVRLAEGLALDVKVIATVEWQFAVLVVTRLHMG